MGTPYVFSYQSWKFGGIIQSWRQRSGSSGNPVYEVVMVDPRDILSGVNIVLGNYNGTTGGVPNLLNVYGYLESLSFGGAQRNEAGMPASIITPTIRSLTKGVAPSYGDAIAIGPYFFELNLDDLPSLPASYRVGAAQMSLLDYVKEICDATNHDYFFSMNFDNDGNRYITISTINRNRPPTFGAINNFVATTEGAVQKDAGFEFRQETMGKFVVGGPLSDIFYRQRNTNQADAWNNTIWPFWGYTNDGRLLLGEGINDNHTVTIDASWMPEWGGNTYTTDVAELRAAKESIDSWKRFLSINNHNRYRRVIGGNETDKYRNSNVEYKHEGVLNPHFNKASILYLEDEDWILEVVGALQNPSDIKGISDKSLKSKALQNAGSQQRNFIREQVVNQMYGYISSFAQEYYGRKFMVIVPDIDAAFEPETDVVLYSAEPDNSGFVDETQWANAIQDNLMPLDVNKFSEDNGKIKAFVRFDNYRNLDLGELSERDVAIGRNGRSVFVLCSVEPVLAFKDGTTLESPRAIITLPGAVKKKIAITDTFLAGPYQLMAKALFEPLAEKGHDEDNVVPELTKAFQRPGGDRFLVGVDSYAIMPDVAAIPMRSNVARYGPWSAAGANGKMELEQDDSLVPWNFGGFGIMNLAAQARIASAISNYQKSESGVVEVPGVPTINLGDVLIDAGPYVTDINVSINSGGIRTTYHMNTWTPQPYRAGKSFVDSVSRVAKTQQLARRNQREQGKNIARTVQVSQAKKLVRALGKRPGSTHPYIFAEPYGAPGDAGRGSAVVFGAGYDLQTQMVGTFTSKAAVGLDALFRPFSTDADQEELPKLELTDDSVNPYVDSDLTFALNGDSPKDAIYDPMNAGFKTGKVRSVGLMTPMIFVGYGKDIGGNPVPSGPNGNYVSNYKQRQDLWKAGPLDVRWNDTTKMWTMEKCEAKNEVHQLWLIGQPTDGTFTWSLPLGGGGSGIMVFDYDETASSFKNKMINQHEDLSSGDVSVVGGPLPNSNLTITYMGNYEYLAIEAGSFDWSELEGFGAGIVHTRYEKGFNDT